MTMALEDFETANLERFEDAWALEEATKLQVKHIARGLQGASFTWLPPLQNFYIEDTVFQWFRLEPQYLGTLSPILMGRAPEGVMPKWLEEEDSRSLEGILDSALGHSHEDRVSWGCKMGISPGQPFLVGCAPPVWSKASYEYDEWDPDYDWTVIRSLPKKPEAAVRSWQRAQQARTRALSCKDNYAATILCQALSSTKNWYLNIHHNDGYYAASPQSVSVTLATTVGKFPKELARGWAYSNNGRAREGEAFLKLVQDFRKAYPLIDLAPLYRLAHKQAITFNALERILFPEYGEDHP